METVEVVGTRLDNSADSMSAQISVIDQDRIESLNKDSVDQLLQALPGVTINRQGGEGGVTSLYLRGGEANFAVVLIDGVQVNNPTNTRGGSFDFSSLDIASIERIELIRGPQSAIYGADALSGVVNIITRRDTSGSSAGLRLEGGSDDYYRVAARGLLQIGERGQLGLGIGRKDAGDVVEGSQHELDFLTGQLDLGLGARSRLWARLRLADSVQAGFPEDSGGPEYAVYRELDERQNQELSAQLGAATQLGESWRTELILNYFETDSSERSPGIFPGTEVPASGADIDFERSQLTWNNQRSWDSGKLALGADVRLEDGTSEGFLEFFGVVLPTDFELERETLGAFAEWQQQFANGLTLSAGLRYDDVEELPSEWTPRIGLLYALSNDATRLRANWGQGFKPPSFFALAHPLVGNPDLKPERADSWDIGVEHRFSNSWLLNLAWFDNRFEDLIDFDDELFTNVNRDEVKTRGLELSAEMPLSESLSLQAHATYTDIRVVGSADRLRGRPEWKAGAQLFYRFAESWAFVAEYLWVDEVYESSLHTGETQSYVLDAYNTMDINLSWQPNETLKLELAISNLFDEDYEQAVGFPAAGFFPRLAISLGL